MNVWWIIHDIMKKKAPQISIIIPTWNEATRVGPLLTYLREYSTAENIREILVIDGGSTDNTVEMASVLGVVPYTVEKGRAKQMNFGAQMAKAEILYFLHADTLPPHAFDTLIINAVCKQWEAGCFRLKFDTSNWFLSFFSWFSRVNLKICRGGDQSLFITQRLFKETNGFNEKYVEYEDTEFIGRLYKKYTFKVLPQRVVTSARKYQKKGTVKLQYHFGVIHLKNMLGAGPEELNEYYKRKIAV